MVDAYEAVTSRRALRGFTDEPVSREVLERVLSAAAWSPSGSNLQPWNGTVTLFGACEVGRSVGEHRNRVV
jgi:nitroreductase